MAADSTGFGVVVDDMEERGHRFVVGDTTGVVTLDEACQLIGKGESLLFNDFVITNDIEDDIGSDQGDAVDFIFPEKLTGDFDHALTSNLFGGEVITDGDGVVEVFKTEERGDLEKTGRGDMVNGCTVFKSGDKEFFLFHGWRELSRWRIMEGMESF
jgi:hypothetical protein